MAPDPKRNYARAAALVPAVVVSAILGVLHVPVAQRIIAGVGVGLIAIAIVRSLDQEAPK
jgi:hypothetical protein